MEKIIVSERNKQSLAKIELEIQKAQMRIKEVSAILDTLKNQRQTLIIAIIQQTEGADLDSQYILDGDGNLIIKKDES